MATRIPPALNAAMLCSYVEFDADNRPFSLAEPLFAISAEPDERRLKSSHFSLYVQLDDEHAVGTFWITAEARTASGFVLPGGRLPPEEVMFTGNPDPMKAVELVFDYHGLVFPEPGRYYFHVLSNHLSLHTCAPFIPPLCLRVLPREEPRGR